MKERPIIMSGDNPRLIIEGKKTQTRRIIKPQPTHIRTLTFRVDDGLWYRWLTREGHFDPNNIPTWRCPYGIAGDRLWVRETWRATRVLSGHSPIGYAIEYKSWSNPIDQYGPWGERNGVRYDDKWHPSIHMPRWASRITLEILKVRVERLQDISEEDAKKEGIQLFQAIRGIYKSSHRPYGLAYGRLWDSLHGKGSWDKNPWVWVIEFQNLTRENKISAVA